MFELWLQLSLPLTWNLLPIFGELEISFFFCCETISTANLLSADLQAYQTLSRALTAQRKTDSRGKRWREKTKTKYKQMDIWPIILFYSLK